MIVADLYLNKIDFLRYLPRTDCKECGEASCAAFVKQMKNGTRAPENCPYLRGNQLRAFYLAMTADQFLPQVPALELPRPAPEGLTEINQANEGSLLIVSGNSEFTQDVLTSIMAYTLSPFWLFFVDCRGDTVDMAMIYQSLKVEKITALLEKSKLNHSKAKREMILPGFASSLREPLARQTGWKVRVGPICIAELPLFLGDDWKVPSDVDLG
ncbi:MAG: (Fe-S)-binding protein [Syntrophobacterales bacterium]|jgi:CO dehydrogenase/acetyl-CoA synthase gamma subunit (corrinoid Fe-S protein)